MAGKKVKTKKRAGGAEKRTASTALRELIAEGGLTDDQIFEAVSKEFKLDASKRWYVTWYRGDMRRKGLNPPGPVKAKVPRGRGAK